MGIRFSVTQIYYNVPAAEIPLFFHLASLNTFHPHPSFLVSSTYAGTSLWPPRLPSRLPSYPRTLPSSAKSLQRLLKDKIAFLLVFLISLEFYLLFTVYYPILAFLSQTQASHPSGEVQFKSQALPLHSTLGRQLLPVAALPMLLWQLQCVTQLSIQWNTSSLLSTNSRDLGWII